MEDEIKQYVRKYVRESIDKILDPILRLIENDPHQWSTRPCQTCGAISSIIGRSFGCVKKTDIELARRS